MALRWAVGASVDAGKERLRRSAKNIQMPGAQLDRDLEEKTVAKDRKVR